MEIKKDIPLAPLTTFGVGGRAKYFVNPTSIKELRQALVFARKNSLPIFILSGGSNLIISDSGYDGLVIRPELLFIKRQGLKIIVGAFYLVDKLVKYTTKRGLAGLEWAGGLPGTIGGAVRGNAGAFGGEIKDTILSVESLDYQGKIIKRGTKQCLFSYRYSIFKTKPEVVTKIVLKLNAGAVPKLELIARANRDYRKRNHPLDLGSAGSIFKNVPVKSIPSKCKKLFLDKIKTDPFPVVPTAVIIARAGLAGEKIGGAQVSKKHTNYIVNTGTATAKDILRLIKKVKEKVYKNFKIKLELEPQIIGDF